MSVKAGPEPWELTEAEVCGIVEAGNPGYAGAEEEIAEAAAKAGQRKLWAYVQSLLMAMNVGYPLVDIFDGGATRQAVMEFDAFREAMEEKAR